MIESIELTNFKCFGEERIRLGAITLATGINGSGKSSLIQSLLLLRQSYDQEALQDGFLALNGDLVQLGAGHDAFFEFAESDKMSLGITWTDQTTVRWDFAYNKSADLFEGASLPLADATISRPPLEGELRYLTAERTGPRPLFAMSDHIVEHQGEFGLRGEFAPHYLARYGRTRVPIQALCDPHAESELIIDQVDAWLGAVSPGVHVQALTHRALDSVQLTFSFDGPGGSTNAYRPMNVGFGLTYVLSIVVAALSARPGSLLIVENPEAHLHPKGQVKITELLARAAAAGVQVLVETHSDHVLNGLRLAVHGKLLTPESAVIHYFERRVTRERVYHAITSPRIDADGRLDIWPLGFFDEMEISLDHLMQPRE